eukprot:jgi/Mesen1/3343/ME000191S02480
MFHISCLVISGAAPGHGQMAPPVTGQGSFMCFSPNSDSLRLDSFTQFVTPGSPVKPQDLVWSSGQVAASAASASSDVPSPGSSCSSATPLPPLVSFHHPLKAEEAVEGYSCAEESSHVIQRVFSLNSRYSKEFHGRNMFPSSGGQVQGQAQGQGVGGVNGIAIGGMGMGTGTGTVTGGGGVGVGVGGVGGSLMKERQIAQSRERWLSDKRQGSMGSGGGGGVPGGGLGKGQVSSGSAGGVGGPQTLPVFPSSSSARGRGLTIETPGACCTLSSCSSSEEGCIAAHASNPPLPLLLPELSSPDSIPSPPPPPPESPSPSRYRTVEFGAPGSLKFRSLFLDAESGGPDGAEAEVSPWSNIPLYAEDGQVNFVCTCPRGSWVKYEVAEDERFHPLRVSRRARRGGGAGGGAGAREPPLPAQYAENLQVNVGFLPQTASDPGTTAEALGGLPYASGPMEVLEIGPGTARVGRVYPVKPLGAFVVVQGGAAPEIACKVVAVAADTLLAGRLSDIDDVRELLPRTFEFAKAWLQHGHCLEPDDKPAVFGFNGRPIGAKEVMAEIAQAHASWQLVVESTPVPAPLLPPGRLRTPDAYELLWYVYTSQLSDAAIPLGESHLGSMVKYERAWVEDGEEEEGGDHEVPRRHLAGGGGGGGGGGKVHPLGALGERPLLSLIGSKLSGGGGNGGGGHAPGGSGGGTLVGTPTVSSPRTATWRRPHKLLNFRGALSKSSSADLEQLPPPGPVAGSFPGGAAYEGSHPSSSNSGPNPGPSSLFNGGGSGGGGRMGGGGEFDSPTSQQGGGSLRGSFDGGNGSGGGANGAGGSGFASAARARGSPPSSIGSWHHHQHHLGGHRGNGEGPPPGAHHASKMSMESLWKEHEHPDSWAGEGDPEQLTWGGARGGGLGGGGGSGGGGRFLSSSSSSSFGEHDLYFDPASPSLVRRNTFSGAMSPAAPTPGGGSGSGEFEVHVPLRSAPSLDHRMHRIVEDEGGEPSRLARSSGGSGSQVSSPRHAAHAQHQHQQAASSFSPPPPAAAPVNRPPKIVATQSLMQRIAAQQKL